MQQMIEIFDVDILVETGTWGGDTANTAAHFFKEVYTVELHHELFLKCINRLNGISNVHCYEGHSPVFLKQVVPDIKGRILFWLDAHWCGDDTALWEDTKTPICDELLAIKESGLQNGIILIDDIRCFQNLPNDYPEFGGYPLVSTIKSLILDINENYAFYVLGDVAIAFPKDDRIKISPLMQSCTTSRLFEDSCKNYDEVLQAEMVIQKYANKPETKAIDMLQRHITPSTEIITYHYMLWNGLVQLGRNNSENAQKCFQKALDAGYRHWRVYWYLSLAKRECGLVEEASQLLDYVISQVPDFDEAKLLIDSL